MNYLVGDIGNTLTKICLVRNNLKIYKEYSIETKKLLFEKNVRKFIFLILKKNIKKKYFFQVLFQMFIEELKNLLIAKIFNVMKSRVFLSKK